MRALTIVACTLAAALALATPALSSGAADRATVTVHGSNYVGDREALQVLCQNVSEFGGLWLVVRPSGATVR